MNSSYIQNHLSHLFEHELIAEISHEGTQATFKAGDEILEISGNREVLEFSISRQKYYHILGGVYLGGNRG